MTKSVKLKFCKPLKQVYLSQYGKCGKQNIPQKGGGNIKIMFLYQFLDALASLAFKLRVTD